MTQEKLELITAKLLLRRWIEKHAKIYRPGAWNYDEDGADLVETTASFLNIENPWRS